MAKNYRVILLFILTVGFFNEFLATSCNSPEQKSNVSKTSLRELGHYLFFDTRLSFNQTKSCASCHDPKFAFTDGYRKSITASGDIVMHNSPSLINVARQYYFDWANDTVTSLHKQSERPLFNIHPVELGASEHESEILIRLKNDSFYQQQFRLNFEKDPDPFRFENIQTALAAFTSSLSSANSPYDKYIKGDTDAISNPAKKGMQLFFSATLKCVRCHQPPYFTTATLTKNTDSIYFNTGLYNVNGKNKYPPDDAGLSMITKNEKDNGRFKIPSLRNVAITAPYTHNGSVNTLSEMINIYANGGRKIGYGPSAGNGAMNKNKSSLITGFKITPEQKNQLMDFLFSLTDSSVLKNPEFQNPFLQK
ncbi:MAG: MbnH family di-heme enzyme [Ginsengibacter sp.]